MSLKKIAAIFALLGLIIPVAFLVFRNPLFPNWVIYLWPSSIFLLATSGHEKSFQAIIILVVSIAVNVLVYLFIGWIVGKLVTAFTRH
jgi:hypothetical protein